jgi:hypothetical protein
VIVRRQPANDPDRAAAPSRPSTHASGM